MPDMYTDTDNLIDADEEETPVKTAKPAFLTRVRWSRVFLFALPFIIAAALFFLMKDDKQISGLQGKPALLKRMEQQRQQPREMAKEAEATPPDTAVDTDIAISAQDKLPDMQALERFFEKEPPAKAEPQENDAPLPITAEKQEQADMIPSASPSAPPQSPLPVANDWQQAVTAQQQQLMAVQQQVNAMQQEMRAEQQRITEAKQLLLQFSAFKASVIEAKPFRSELRVLLGAEVIPQEVKTSLEYFTPLASEGIASLDTLQQEFDASLTAYYQPDTENQQALLGKVGNWFSSLITVRKIGAEHQGDSDEEILARAEHWLQQGNVSRALKEVRALSVQASPHFKEWRAKAYAYKHARELLPEIEQRLFTIL